MSLRTLYSGWRLVTCKPIKIPKKLYSIQPNMFPWFKHWTVVVYGNFFALLLYVQSDDIDQCLTYIKRILHKWFLYLCLFLRDHLVKKIFWVLLLGNFGRWLNCVVRWCCICSTWASCNARQPVSFLSMVVGKGSLAHCFYSFLPHCVRASVDNDASLAAATTGETLLRLPL